MDCTETALTLTTDDGVTLAARRFDPASEPRAAVVIHGAVATPRRYYDRFARWLAAQGFTVLAYDYRGVGDSRPRSLRGFSADIRAWGERDAVAALRHLRAARPSLPVYAVTHSFGGQSFGLHDALREVDGVVMVGVQFGYVGHWPLRSRAVFGAVWQAAFPLTAAILGYVPGWVGVGEDLPAGVALQWARWCNAPGYLMDEVPEARARYAALRAPVLYYSFTDDDYAPSGAVRHYLGAICHARVTHRRLRPADVDGRPIGHHGFFRPAHADTLWPEVATYLNDLLAGRRPSVPAASPPGWIELPADEELLADLAFGRE
ncbi:MAG: alpha/beta fold hydrolase [Polyangiales bacterium]